MSYYSSFDRKWSKENYSDNRNYRREDSNRQQKYYDSEYNSNWNYPSQDYGYDQASSDPYFDRRRSMDPSRDSNYWNSNYYPDQTYTASSYSSSYYDSSFNYNDPYYSRSANYYEQDYYNTSNGKYSNYDYPNYGNSQINKNFESRVERPYRSYFRQRDASSFLDSPTKSRQYSFGRTKNLKRLNRIKNVNSSVESETQSSDKLEVVEEKIKDPAIEQMMKLTLSLFDYKISYLLGSLNLTLKDLENVNGEKVAPQTTETASIPAPTNVSTTSNNESKQNDKDKQGVNQVLNFEDQHIQNKTPVLKRQLSNSSEISSKKPKNYDDSYLENSSSTTQIGYSESKSNFEVDSNKNSINPNPDISQNSITENPVEDESRFPTNPYFKPRNKANTNWDRKPDDTNYLPSSQPNHYQPYQNNSTPGSRRNNDNYYPPTNSTYDQAYYEQYPEAGNNYNWDSQRRDYNNNYYASSGDYRGMDYRDYPGSGPSYDTNDNYRDYDSRGGGNARGNSEYYNSDRSAAYYRNDEYSANRNYYGKSDSYQSNSAGNAEYPPTLSRQYSNESTYSHNSNPNYRRGSGNFNNRTPR